MTPSNVSSQSPVVLLTGANGGIGRAVAHGLLRHGARLLIVCRTAPAANELANELTAAFPGAQVTGFAADLSALSSIQTLIADIKDCVDRVDVLIHNAGYFTSTRQPTADGFESMLAVNYLAPFALTHGLLDRLRRAVSIAGEARVIVVTSSIFRWVKVDVRNLNASHRFQPWPQYGRTKRAVLMFACEAAERLRAESINVNVLHPGLVNTRIVEKHSSVGMAAFWRIFKRFLLSPDQAAETYVRLALSPECRHVTGRYYEAGTECSLPEDVRHSELSRQLWETTERLITLPTDQQLPATATSVTAPRADSVVEQELSMRQQGVFRLSAGYHAALGIGLWLFPGRLQSWFGITPAGWGVPFVMTLLTMLGLAVLHLALSRRPALPQKRLRMAMLIKVAESSLLMWNAWAAGWSAWMVALDVVWVLPLLGALRQTREAQRASQRIQRSQGALSTVTDQHGQTLATLSAEQPVLVLCVRHTGCAFCREALADLSQARESLDHAGVGLAVVHMSPDEIAADLCQKYGLPEIPRFADPQRRIYAALSLPEGGLKELVPLNVWTRGYVAAISAKHGIGKIIGNVRQLAGAAVIWRGEVVSVERSKTACDRLDLGRLAETASERCGLETAATNCPV